MSPIVHRNERKNNLVKIKKHRRESKKTQATKHPLDRWFHSLFRLLFLCFRWRFAFLWLWFGLAALFGSFDFFLFLVVAVVIEPEFQSIEDGHTRKFYIASKRLPYSHMAARQKYRVESISCDILVVADKDI